jgi:ABC-type transport system substrate-binding protein
MYQFSISFTGIVDHLAIAEFGHEDNRAAIGSGPYMIASYRAGDTIELKAFPNYWREDRMPNIETVYFRVIPDVNTQLLALEIGDIDYMRPSGGLMSSLVMANDDINVHTILQSGSPIWFNTTKGHLGNPIVREALVRLVDVDLLVEAAYDGMARALDAPWPRSTSAYVESPHYYFNREEGLALLRGVGLEPSDIQLSANDWSVSTPVFTALQGQLQALGINFTFETYDMGTVSARNRAGDWDIAWISGGYSSFVPITAFDGLIATGATQRVNFFEEVDPLLDSQIQAHIQAARNAWTFEEHTENLRAVTRLLMDNYALFFAIEVYTVHAFSNRVENIIICNGRFNPLIFLMHVSS